MKLFFTILLIFVFSKVDAQKNIEQKVPDEVEFKNFLSQADIFLLKGQPEKALSAYNSCLKLNPNSAAANFQLARIYYNYKDFDAAMNFAISAVKLQPDNYWYNVFLATVYETTNNYSEALKIYEKLIQKNPTYQDYLRLVNFYTQFNKFSSAIFTLNKIEEIYGYDFDLSLKKIDIFRRQNKFDAMENEFCKILLTDSSNLSYLGMLEDFYLSTSQISKAQSVLKKMKSIDDKNPLSYLAQAYFCRATAQTECFYQNLIESFRSEEISTKEKISIIQDIVMNSENFSEEKVSELYDAVLKTSGENFEVLSSYADFLMVIENYDKAAEVLRLCTKIDKSDFSLWRKIFKVYVMTEDFRGLKSAVEDAEEYFPAQVEVMLYSAVAFMSLKDFSSAEDMLSQARDFGIEMTDAANLFYFYSGVYNYKIGKTDDAFKCFQQYYNLNHSDYNILAQYAYYLVDSKKDLPLAQTIIKQCVAFDNFNYYFHYVYAFYMFRTGDLKSAQYFIEKSNSLNAMKKYYTFELAGDIFQKAGDCERAVSFWSLSLSYGSDKETIDAKIRNCK